MLLNGMLNRREGEWLELCGGSKDPEAPAEYCLRLLLTIVLFGFRLPDAPEK